MKFQNKEVMLKNTALKTLINELNRPVHTWETSQKKASNLYYSILTLKKLEYFMS